MANVVIPVSEVVNSKIRPDNRTLILDTGMNDRIRPMLYSAYHEIVPCRLRAGKKPITRNIVGGICETTDYFVRDRGVAAEGMPGERGAFLSSGVYGFSMTPLIVRGHASPKMMTVGSRVKLIGP